MGRDDLVNDERIAREQALCGLDRVDVEQCERKVVLQRDYDVHVLEGDGPLLHWTEAADASPEHLTVHADDLSGWYCAGATRFDLTELAQMRIT
jgi:hypothetical protein